MRWKRVVPRHRKMASKKAVVILDDENRRCARGTIPEDYGSALVERIHFHVKQI